MQYFVTQFDVPLHTLDIFTCENLKTQINLQAKCNIQAVCYWHKFMYMAVLNLKVHHWGAEEIAQ